MDPNNIWIVFSQTRHPNGQQVHEKVLSITHHQGNANQNHSQRVKLGKLKLNQLWIFMGRTDAEAEAPTLWPPGAKNRLIGKIPDAEKNWDQEKVETENEMVKWHHWLNKHKSEQTPGDSEDQGSLAHFHSWGHKQLDMTEWLNNNNNSWREDICIISKYLGEDTGNPLQYSCWKIPWTEEPGRLRSMGSRRVGHDWATSLSLFTLMHWRRKWQPTPVFLPGESQRRGSLVGCCLWGCTESDTTDST